MLSQSLNLSFSRSVAMMMVTKSAYEAAIGTFFNVGAFCREAATTSVDLRIPASISRLRMPRHSWLSVRCERSWPLTEATWTLGLRDQCSWRIACRQHRFRQLSRLHHSSWTSCHPGLQRLCAFACERRSSSSSREAGARAAGEREAATTRDSRLPLLLSASLVPSSCLLVFLHT